MTLKMICFNGMNWTVRMNATSSDLHEVVERRKKQGYDCTYISPFEVEITSDQHIDDYCGYLKLVKTE